MYLVFVDTYILFKFKYREWTPKKTSESYEQANRCWVVRKLFQNYDYIVNFISRAKAGGLAIILNNK